MATVNHDLVQIAQMIFMDRYVTAAYHFFDFTAVALAAECSWQDWLVGYEAAQLAFYGFVPGMNTHSERAGQFLPRMFLGLRWANIPAGSVWRGTATLTVRASVTAAGLHDVPQTVRIYASDRPVAPVIARDNVNDGTFTDPQYVPLPTPSAGPKKILLTSQPFPNGFALDAGLGQDISFTFDATLLNHVFRNPAWNGGLVMFMETERLPFNTAGGGGETAMFNIHSPASLPGTPVGRITVDQVVMPFYQGRSYSGQASSRFDVCPRCGQLSLREKWVRDGLTMKLVCPRCYDPPIPRRRPPMPVRPGTNEGN